MKRTKFAAVEYWKVSTDIKRGIFDVGKKEDGVYELELDETDVTHLEEIGETAPAMNIKEMPLPVFALSLSDEDIPYELYKVLSPDNYTDLEVDVFGLQVLFLKAKDGRGVLCSFGVHRFINGEQGYDQVATFEIIPETEEGSYYYLLPVGTGDDTLYTEFSIAAIAQYLTCLWSGVQTQMRKEHVHEN